MGDIAFSFAFVGLKSFGSYTAGVAAVDLIATVFSFKGPEQPLDAKEHDV